MRIISGKYKNKKLLFSKNLETRPLKDSVRENIFNILAHSSKIKIDVKNSNILDLYSGTGSFGLECLSREASKVFFIENNKDALLYLKRNIKSLDSEKKTLLLSQDVFKFLKNFDLKTYKYKFDIIFLDPPYKKECFETIEILKKNNITNQNHIIIIHREINSGDEIEKQLNILDNRIYGRSKIFFAKFF